MAEETKENLTPEEEKLMNCKKELRELLEKYDCVLDVGVLILAGRMPQPIIKIVPKPPQLIVPNGKPPINFPWGNIPLA